MSDDLIMTNRGWDDAATTDFLTGAIYDVLADAAQQTVTAAHTAPTPILRSKVGPSTLSPIPGTVRRSVEWWIDFDRRGQYAAVGNRGVSGVVGTFLGAAGGSGAKQIRRKQAYLIAAYEATVGLPLGEVG